MIISVHGIKYDANPENSARFVGNTLLNGLYTDLDDDYVFIPAELEDYPEEQCDDEGIPVYELVEYDPTAPPFCFIINALCRVFRQEIDELTDGR